MIRFASPALPFLRHAKIKVTSEGHTSARDVKAIGPANDAKIQFPTPIMKTAENAIPMRVRGPAGLFFPRKKRWGGGGRDLRGKKDTLLVNISPLPLLDILHLAQFF